MGALLRRPSTDLGIFGDAKLWGWLQTLSLGQVATWFELCVWLKVLNAGLIALGATWLVVGVLRHSRQRVPLLGTNSAVGEPSGRHCLFQTVAHRREELALVARRAKWFAAIISAQLLLAAVTFPVTGTPYCA